ncbi:MFS transporter [Brevibacillus composti]|uniref:MFS transporter n=1 Tax=Brevibacillus composti TaxID=2796470 RepID=A0A7T5EN23_9BACL|nr:MFS transporter [Brevibacillus composti]QQE75593.1 MFS transporter [Brevibacillus composti]QUO42619.1 MFS transporter [Brevibacillus composti]
MAKTAAPKAKHNLWKDSQFLRLWTGNLLSALADGAFFIALSWFIVDVTGSEAILGTTLLCMSIPRLIFMLVGGAAADKYNRKWIMFASILARGVIIAGFGLLLLQDGLAASQSLPYAAYLTAFLFGTVDAFFWPARSSILPSVVRREHLAPANSLLEVAQQISLVGGPLVAALLLRNTSYAWAFLLMSGAFFAGTLILYSLRLRPLETEAEENTSASLPAPASEKGTFLRQIFEGIRYTRTVPVLLLIFGTSLVINMMFSGPVNMGLPLLVKQLGWDSHAYSSLSTALGIGTIIGGAVAGLCNGFRGRFLLIPLFLSAMGLGVAAASQMSALSFGLAMMLIAGTMMAMTNIPLIIYIQTIVPGHMLGRVMSLLTFMSVGLGPVSYALCSYLLERKILAAHTLLLVGGAAIGVLGLGLLMFRHFRQAEQHPLWVSGGTAKPASEAEQAPLSV